MTMSFKGLFGLGKGEPVVNYRSSVDLRSVYDNEEGLRISTSCVETLVMFRIEMVIV